MKRQRRNRVRKRGNTKKWKRRKKKKNEACYGAREVTVRVEEEGKRVKGKRIERNEKACERERKREKVKQKKGKDGEYVQDENGAESSVEERQK